MLDMFGPATREWSRGAFTAPTDAQRGAWTAIAAGKPEFVSDNIEQVRAVPTVHDTKARIKRIFDVERKGKRGCIYFARKNW